MSVEAFAAREGVAASTLYGWLRAPRVAPRIARVVVTPAKALPATGEAPVLLEFAGVRMSVRRGFDRRVLADVQRVLEQQR